MRRRFPEWALLALAVALAIPGAATADGGYRPPSSPATPSPQIPQDRPMTPEEKAQLDRRQAEELYASAYREAYKGKAELAEAEALAAAGDEKSAEKAKKKRESAAKRFKKSLDKLLTATQLVPDYHEAWNMLGFCYRKTGDLEKAFGAYGECLRLEPDYEPAHEYRGEAYLMAGELEKARAELAWLKERKSEEAEDLEKEIEKYVKAHPEAAQAPASGD